MDGKKRKKRTVFLIVAKRADRPKGVFGGTRFVDDMALVDG